MSKCHIVGNHMSQLISVFQVPTRLDGWLGIPKRPANEPLVSEAKKELAKAITNIAEYYLKDKPFLIGDEISIADLSGVAELTGLRGCNEEGIYESNSVVCAWVKRVQDHVKNYFEEAMESIEATRKQYNSSKE